MLSSTEITLITIYALEAFCIIIGNSFAIFVFWKQRLYERRICFLLINLAVADLLVGIAEPTALSTGGIDKIIADRKGKSGPIPSVALQTLASSTSVFFLVLIALERVYAVLWPLRLRVTKTRVYIYGIVIVWVFGLCSAGLTSLSIYYKKVKLKKYVAASIRICQFIALLVICTSYIKIRNRLRSTSAEIALQSNRSTEQNLRLSRTMFIVIAASLVFWLPAFAAFTVREFCKECFAPAVKWVVTHFYLANSMVNPFVYTFRMPIFKDALKKFWRKRQNLEVHSAQAKSVGFELGRYFHSPNGTRKQHFNHANVVTDDDLS